MSSNTVHLLNRCRERDCAIRRTERTELTERTQDHLQEMKKLSK